MQRGSFILGSFGLAGALISGTASAIFVDGHGYYSLRGETRTKPEFQAGSSTFQAVDQFFRLDTELRVNDKSSVFMEFKVFDDEREAFLGDTAKPQPCPSGANTPAGTDCQINHQNSGEPRYQPYQPKVTKLYAKYAMDYCLLTAGRRGRQWGMGILLDDGTRPFTTDASVFDGVTCDINIQKSQTLGFSVGYDKITETGSSILSNGVDNQTYGATNNGDDLDQFFLTIEYNDHRANAGKGFSKQIGIYFANVVGGDNNRTDLKIADLYLNFQLQDLVLQNEAVFRLGKSADPSWSLLGGARTLDDVNDKVSNDLQSIALAGSLEYFLSRSGAYLGPKEYNQGNATSHSLFAGYAYAPGDADGYSAEYPDPSTPVSPRDKKVSAFAFHPNFKPGLLLFNGRKKSDSMRIDGVFDPYRVVNATVFNAGYRYQSVENGNFEAKLVTAKLNEAMPTSIKEGGGTGVGANGDNLGFEVDLSYTRALGKEMEFGFAGAIGLPGNAWETSTDAKVESSYLLQSHVTFNF